MKKEYPDILKLEGEKWQNPDPATGKLGTRVPAEWLQTTEDSLKSLTLEMLEVLKSAGINPNELNNTQVRDAIQKMILSRVINYNDIQGRPVVKDSLGDDRNNPASQRVVNDVNRAASTAQKSANNAHALAQTKQDKLTFVGRGPEVMREGAYGLGYRGVDPDDLISGEKTSFYYWRDNKPEFEVGDIPGFSTGLLISGSVANASLLVIDTNNGEAYTLGKGASTWRKPRKHYDDANTSIDSSGFLRTSGNKETFTKDLVSQSTGSSTTNVMSQKAVTDRLNSIESGHGLGYGQTWVNVTGQRSTDTIYTNNTNKPIFVFIRLGGAANDVLIDGNIVVGKGSTASHVNSTFIVPSGSTYMTKGPFTHWSELR